MKRILIILAIVVVIGIIVYVIYKNVITKKTETPDVNTNSVSGINYMEDALSLLYNFGLDAATLEEVKNFAFELSKDPGAIADAKKKIINHSMAHPDEYLVLNAAYMMTTKPRNNKTVPKDAYEFLWNELTGKFDWSKQ
jgi:hypothetical protein